MEIIASFVPVAGVDPVADFARPPVAATMVEIRADLLGAGIPMRRLVEAAPRPVVMTLRSRAEGGLGPDGGEERARFAAEAATSGAAFIDLELERDAGLLGTVVPRERAIASVHLPDVPADLDRRVADWLGCGARFVKVVPAAHSLADVLAVVRAAGMERGRRAERRAIVFATGDAGRATRLLAPLLGAPVAYAAWGAGRVAAPGQYTADEIAALIGHLAGAPRRLFGVLAGIASHSLSPRMHNAAFASGGMPNLFVPIVVSDEAELANLIRPAGEGPFDGLGLPCGGWAVTMPWKSEAAGLCGVLAPRAKRAAAVNTVLPRPGKVLGDCTDIDGITRALIEAGVKIASCRALVLGGGGAARAAVVALDLAGAEVAMAGRDLARLATVAVRLGVGVVDLAASEEFDLVVNATPAGADGDVCAMLAALRLPGESVALDLAYGDGPTGLDRLARERGWTYIAGRQVLLWQGVAQFAAMNGLAPPVATMAAALGLDGGAAGGAASARHD